MIRFLNSRGLGYTVKQSINPVNIISEDKTILARIHTPQVVAEHERAWTFLVEATVDALFEETVLAAQTLKQAWHVIVGWGLPTSDAEKALLVRQPETVQMEVGEDPKIYFARVDKRLNTLKSVGIVKEEREIVRIIVINLSDEYMVEKRSHPLTMLNISRFEVEETVRASYANRKYSDLGKLSVAVPAKAPPPVVMNDPHALAVGGGLRGGGSGGQRQSRGGPGGRRRGQQRGGRGQQQQQVSGVEWAAAVTCRWANAAATVPAAICSSTAAASAAAATVSAAIRSATAAATIAIASPFLSSCIAEMGDRGAI